MIKADFKKGLVGCRSRWRGLESNRSGWGSGGFSERAAGIGRVVGAGSGVGGRSGDRAGDRSG